MSDVNSPVPVATCFLDLEDDSAALYKAFQLKFPSVKVTQDDLPALLGQRDVDQWYKAWKYTRNSFKALPTVLKGTGLTGEVWAVYLEAHAQRAALRKAHADITRRLAEEHKAKVKAANDNLESQLAPTNTKLVKLLDTRVGDLPLGLQAQLLAIKDKPAKDKASNDAIAAFVKAGLVALKIADVNDRGKVLTSDAQGIASAK
jgi:hypothetical protein